MADVDQRLTEPKVLDYSVGVSTPLPPHAAELPASVDDDTDIEEREPSPPGIVSFDLRSLALFRIAFGFVILLDLLARIPEITEFYTDAGVLPRAFLLSRTRSLGAYSLQYISGEWVVQFAILLCIMAAVCCFIVGYRTRRNTVIAWLLIMSMQGRNPFVLHGGDDMIRILLFWSIFAPLNGRWSLDAALNREQPPLPVTNASWGTQALIFQLCFVYWFTAAWKWHPVWTTEGSAIYYALNLDQFARPLGKWLLQFPDLLRVMTRATISLEFFGPFLLFVPFWTRWFRILAMLSFIGLHMGIFLTMQIGLFPWICMTAWLIVLPAMVWDNAGIVASRLSTSMRRHLTAWRVRIADALERCSARLGKPRAPRGELGIAGGIFVVAYSLMIFVGNFMTLPQTNAKVPLPIALAEALLGLHQRWAMFAPYPLTKDGWFQVVGTRPNAPPIDIWNGGVPTAVKPAYATESYRDVRWNKYLSLIAFDQENRYRPYFGDYLCRSWNGRHPADSRVDHIAINYFVEVTPPPGKPFAPVTTEALWQQQCAPEAPS